MEVSNNGRRRGFWGFHLAREGETFFIQHPHCMNLGQGIKYGIFLNTHKKKIDLDKTHELMGEGGGGVRLRLRREYSRVSPLPSVRNPDW